MFYKLTSNLLEDKNISLTEKIIFLLLETRFNYSVENNFTVRDGINFLNGFAIFTDAELQQKLLLSRSTISRSFKKLEKLKYLEYYFTENNVRYYKILKFFLPEASGSPKIFKDKSKNLTPNQKTMVNHDLNINDLDLEIMMLKKNPMYEDFSTEDLKNMILNDK